MNVHYNPTSLANIIYLKDAESLNGVTVAMDTSEEHAIKMSLPNGNKLVFKECNDGINNLNINNINKDVVAYLCLQNFNKNKTHFTWRKITRVEKARFLQQQIGWPSYTTFKSTVANNLITNNGINVKNIELEVYIYGTPTEFQKGK